MYGVLSVVIDKISYESLQEWIGSFGNSIGVLSDVVLFNLFWSLVEIEISIILN